MTAAAPRPPGFSTTSFEVVHDETGEHRQGMQRKLSDAEAREIATHAQGPLWSWALLWPAIIGTGWIVTALRGERPCEAVRETDLGREAGLLSVRGRFAA